MNILYVSRAAPNANGKGVERRAAQHLRTLLKLGDVTMVLPAAAAEAARAAGLDLSRLGLREVIIRAEPTRAELTQHAYDQAKAPLARLWRAIQRRYDVDQTAQKADAARYAQRLAGRFDLLFAFRISSAVWADSVFGFGAGRPRVSIVDFDDIESVAMARNTRDLQASPLWRILVRRYVSDLQNIERRLVRRWTGVCTCSKADAEVLGARYGARAHVIPNAVDFTHPLDETISPEVNLLFVGTFSYAPNVAGLTWFVDEVWPTLRKALGDRASLSVVGFDPPPEILAMDAVPGVWVFGPVADLGEPYRRANIVIVPIFSGSGTRIKLIEALAHRRAVVTTTLGCEGLELEDGRHAAIADTPAAFAVRVMELATDSAARAAMAEAGRVFGQERYADPVVAAALEAILRREMRLAEG